MRENVKNIGLILALLIAGVSLPTSIISFMNKPTTPITEINNYYYNTTIIEQYNTTIIYNNTIYDLPNATIEYYHFDNIPDATIFLNLNYTLTQVSIFIILATRIYYTNMPELDIYKDSIKIYDGYISVWGNIMLFDSGYYEFEFYNYVANENCSICIISEEI